MGAAPASVGCIEAEDLPAYCHSTPRCALRPVDEVERDAVIGALREAGGNRVAAAAASAWPAPPCTGRSASTGSPPKYDKP